MDSSGSTANDSSPCSNFQTSPFPRRTFQRRRFQSRVYLAFTLCAISVGKVALAESFGCSPRWSVTAQQCKICCHTQGWTLAVPTTLRVTLQLPPFKAREKSNPWLILVIFHLPVCPSAEQTWSPGACTHPHRRRSPATLQAWTPPWSLLWDAWPAPRWLSIHPCGHRGFSTWLLFPTCDSHSDYQKYIKPT